MTGFPDWAERLKATLSDLGEGSSGNEAFLVANSGAITRALTGVPAGRANSPGACVVVNMSAAHVPSLTHPGAAYKNCYDLDHGARIGERPKTSAKRLMVDDALEPLHGLSKEEIYFAAIEFNGCGIGFYGDFCLVLDDDVTQQDAVVLDRNSYDLIREPLHDRISKVAAANGLSESDARVEEAFSHAGKISSHLAPIASIKVLESRPAVARLLTTGGVSEAVLDDEDYIEVLRRGTFGYAAIREVRLAPGDVALDERVRSRTLIDDAPSQTEMLWRSRRRIAEARLRAVDIPVRVVTTAGRTKG